MPEITVFDMIVSVGIKIAIRKYWINKQYLKQIENVGGLKQDCRAYVKTGLGIWNCFVIAS